MLKCSIFLPFSLEIKTESNTHFSVECHTKMLVCFLIEQARQALGFCFPEVLFHNREFSERTYLEIMMYLCSQISKTKQTWKFDHGVGSHDHFLEHATSSMIHDTIHSITFPVG